MIKWFIKNYPDYVTKMRECSYHHGSYMNLHHLEGDVWSHTMLSFSKGLNFGVSKIILLSLLLHDIGRIKTRHIQKDGSLFFGDFEGVSCFIALEILNALPLTDNEKVRTLKVIMHQYDVIDFVKYNEIGWNEFALRYRYDEILLKDLFSYVKCDLFGRFIDKTKAKYYDLDNMLTYEKKASLIDIKMPPSKDKDKKELYIIVGLPCSQKTSWIKENFLDAHIISRDSVVSEVGKKHNVFTFDEASYLEDTNESVANEVDVLYKQLIDKGYKTDLPVIIDNTSVTVSKRKKWIQRYKDTHNINAVVFLKSYSDVMQCNNNRSLNENKTVNENVMLKQMINFKFPLLNEGFCDIKYIFS